MEPPEQTKEKCLDAYMAKNLYYLVCPLWSEFNAEIKYAGKQWAPDVALIFQGYQVHKQFRTEYITYDDEWFWCTPQENE